MRRLALMLVLVALGHALFAPFPTLAKETDEDRPIGAIGGAVHADPFTGVATTSIPIEVPPGRNGMQPNLQLVYNSSSGNGWVGMGWELEQEGIFRQTKWGVDYSNNTGDKAFTVKMSGVSGDLMQSPPPAPSNQWSAKIEGGFSRIEQLTAGDGQIMWKVTTKLGRKYYFGDSTNFGQPTNARQVDPGNAANIFGWLLNRVEDPDGNYMCFYYFLDSINNQVYLDHIDYASNTVTGATATNTVTFWRDDGARPDQGDMYTTNYRVKTKYRVKTIEIRTNTNSVRCYKLSYDSSTSRSLLVNLQQFGKDAIIDGNGTITNEAVAMALPKTVMTYSSVPGTFQVWTWTSGGNWSDYEMLPGDFNGDGKTDIYIHQRQVSASPDWMALSTGTSFSTWTWGSGGNWGNYEAITGDFNGDGKTDIYLHEKEGANVGERMGIANQSGTGFDLWTWSWGPGWGSYEIHTGDFNGDGKTDIYLHARSGKQLYDYMGLSTGSGFNVTPWTWSSGGVWSNFEVITADFNGDGKTDLYLHEQQNTNVGERMGLSTGTAFSLWTWSWGTGWGTYDLRVADFNGDGKADLFLNAKQGTGFSDYMGLGTGTSFITDWTWTNGANWSNYEMSSGDFDGDGRADLYIGGRNGSGGWDNVGLSNSTSFQIWTWTNSVDWSNYEMMPGDFNGDGKTDLYVRGRAGSGGWDNMGLSIGSSIPSLITSIQNGLSGATTVTYDTSANDANNRVPFAVQRVKSLTTCDNWNASATPPACAGTSSTTSYSYSGGFYHIGERDIRGVSYVKETGPAGPNGEQIVTETWFHQGNGVTAVADDPTVSTGYAKGLPYEVKVSRINSTGGAQIAVSDTTTSYLADPDGVAPWFTPAAVVTTSVYDNSGTTVTKQTQTENVSYDLYGNLTLAYNRGDWTNGNAITSDDSTTAVTYGNYDTTNWLLAFPTVTTTYAGLGTSGTMISQTSTWYDGASSCTAPAGNLVPTRGHVTKIQRSLDQGGTSPISGMEYDAFGNLTCTRDPLGNRSYLAYDSATSTFPLTSTNALGHVTTTSYYGVNGVPMDTGLYGQVKSVTDSNNQTATSTYDALGRKLTTTTPDGLVTTMTYNYGGTFSVGTQNIQRTISGGGLSTALVSKTYFDGLGRTIRTEKPGAADGGASLKVLVTETQYDTRGLVKQTSLPYIQGTESAMGRWKVMTYDALGRLTQMTNPDTTSTTVCYNGWTTTTLDPKLHKKVETKDAFGRLVTVQEYTGTGSAIDCTGGTLYATTSYIYNLAGNLLSVTDTKGNVSTMTYDTLGRKLTMQDPDMGTWAYSYDANGNLLTQIDAKSQKLCFSYDALNRRIQKNYGTTTQACGTNTVVYSYDDPVTANNGKGRLKQVTDPAQSVTFQYDSRGRITQSAKTLDGTTYTTTSAYDGLGRLTSVNYPTNPITTVTYTYDGPQLKQVTEGAATYVAYAGWNALGQPATATYGNGVVTTYTYADPAHTSCVPQNTFKLCTLKTQQGTNPLYQDLRYDYEANGNVWNIYDATVANNAGDQHFSYDDLDRLTLANGPYGTSGANASLLYAYDEIGNLTFNTQLGTYTYPASGSTSVQPHAATAAGSNSYTYDANGNLTSGAGRTYTWNPENKPLTVVQGGTTTTFVYDGDGRRVKKIGGTTTTRYLSKLYECDNTSCSRFIWAGSTRVASVAIGNGTVTYWHADHLGSSSVITDATGNQVQAITYYPYGNTRTNQSFTIPAIDVPYKYTGKELDSTGLYYYEARYYDPVLARFISADTIVPNPRDPQSLNRYSYVGNNPLKYIDPTGHFKIKGLFKGLNKFIEQNMALRVLAWVVNPVQMMFLDPATRPMATSAVAGLATTVLTGNPVLGGMAAGAVGGYMNQLEGQNGNIIKGALAGGASATVSLGLGSYLNPLITAAAAGATHSAVMGGDPGTGAWMGTASALGMSALEIGVLKLSLPIYNASVPAPANSVGYVLPDSPGSYAISVVDGGPFSHTVTTDANGNLIGATVGGSQAAQYQTVGSMASLEGRQILWVQGVLSSGAAVNALSGSLGVSYNFVGIGGSINCAEFSSRALANSGISANGLSPNGQFYEMFLSH